jgi:hypothetical protein
VDCLYAGESVVTGDGVNNHLLDRHLFDILTLEAIIDSEELELVYNAIVGDVALALVFLVAGNSEKDESQGDWNGKMQIENRKSLFHRFAVMVNGWLIPLVY